MTKKYKPIDQGEVQKHLSKEELLNIYKERGGDEAFFKFFYLRYDDAYDTYKYWELASDRSFRDAFNEIRWYAFYKKIGHNEDWCSIAMRYNYPKYDWDNINLDFFNLDIEPEDYIDKEISFENDMECLKLCMVRCPDEHEYHLHRAYYESLIVDLFPDYIDYGIPSGFPSIDRVTRGFHDANLIIIASEPMTGKTAMSFQIAFESAFMGKTVLVLYMGLEERIRNEKSLLEFIKTPLFVDETQGLSLNEFCNKTRRYVREKGVKLVIVDYLQLMKSKDQLLGSRPVEMVSIVKSMKELAVELAIPIIALSQLRKFNTQERPPQLIDLPEYPSMAQEADLIVFLHRPKMHEDYPQKDRIETAQVIIAKNNNGELGEVSLLFNTKRCSFGEP